MDNQLNNTQHAAVKVIVRTLKNMVPKQVYKEGDTLADVAYKQGQLDFIDVVERTFLGGT